MHVRIHHLRKLTSTSSVTRLTAFSSLSRHLPCFYPPLLWTSSCKPHVTTLTMPGTRNTMQGTSTHTSPITRLPSDTAHQMVTASSIPSPLSSLVQKPHMHTFVSTRPSHISSHQSPPHITLTLAPSGTSPDLHKCARTNVPFNRTLLGNSRTSYKLTSS